MSKESNKSDEISLEIQRLRANIEVQSEVLDRVERLVLAVKEKPQDFVGDVDKCVQTAAGDSKVKRSALNTAAPPYNDIIDTIVVDFMTKAAELQNPEAEAIELVTQLESYMQSIEHHLVEYREKLDTLIKRQKEQPATHGEDHIVDALPETLEFSQTSIKDYEEAHRFLRSNPKIVTMAQGESLLLNAFEQVLMGRPEEGKKLCQNSLLIQNCAKVRSGIEGIDFFFKEMSDPINPKWKAFEKEVDLVFNHVEARCKRLTSGS